MSLPITKDIPTCDMGVVIRPRWFLPPSLSLSLLPLLPPHPAGVLCTASLYTGSDRRTSNLLLSWNSHLATCTLKPRSGEARAGRGCCRRSPDRPRPAAEPLQLPYDVIRRPEHH